MDFGYIVGLIGSGLKWCLDVLVAGLPGIASTFLGASLAFLAERLKRRREEEDRSVNALNRGLFTIYQMWNFLRQYQRDHLDDIREQPDRWLNLTSNPLAAQARTQFEAGELSFILDKDANLFAKVMLQDYRFKLAVGLIERRSELMLRVAFPRMEQANVLVGQHRVLAEVERLLGNGVTHQLRQYTDQIFEFVDADVPDLETAFAELRDAAKRLYPKRDFFGVDFNPGPIAPGLVRR
jgi:hypothetical protein